MDMQATLSRLRPFLMMGTGLVAGLAWPLLHHQAPWLPGLLIGALGIGDWLFPSQLAPLWRRLEKAGKTVAHYNGLFMLSLIYLLVITPAGLFLQLVSRLRQGDRPTHSFYERPDNREAGNMRRMF